MAYDEKLAARVRKALGKKPGIVEKRLFAGVGFMLNGNMCCGVHADELIVRVDPDETEKLVAEKGAHRFDLTGRPMKGWLLVGPKGIADAVSLGKWIRRGTAYAGSLPPK